MLKVVLVGVMLSFTAVFGVVAWLSLRPAPVVVAADAPAPPPPPARVVILAWARAIQAGTLIKPEDITALDLPAASPPDGTRPDSVQGRSELIGGMVRRTVLAQEPLLTTQVLRPADGGFLAAVLAPEHRAVSVAVDAVSGTSGLIWPGDRVDLILTQETGEQGTPVGRRTFGETVLKDVRVIAVDQQLAHGVSPDAANAGQGNRTVTLEVLPEAAERVAVAVRLGRVSLTVRAAVPPRPATPESDKDVTAASASTVRAPVMQVSAPQQTVQAPSATVPKPQPPTTWGSDVSPALGGRGGPTATAPSRSNSVKVFQGSADGKEFKFE
ncbi:MAG TPA: Flp pilus assembly protein CpaB [Acetobacteraceae bacterium]